MVKYDNFDQPQAKQPERRSAVKTPVQPGPTSDSRDSTDDTVLTASPGENSFLALQQDLQSCLAVIDTEVMKSYLPTLQDCPVIPFEESAIDGLEEIQFFRITELVYQEDEFSVHKLATVFHTLSNKLCTLVLMIQSDGQDNAFYLGVRSKRESNSTGTMRQMLEKSLLGLFPGSSTAEYLSDTKNADLERLGLVPNQGENMKIGCVSSVSCIADYKQEKTSLENKSFFQGLEKFIYSMQGKAV